MENNWYKEPTKAQRKYMDFLNLDGGFNFEYYIGVQLPKREYSSEGVRLVSTKYSNVKGEFKPLLKDAKLSYKEVLRKKLAEIRQSKKALEYPNY